MTKRAASGAGTWSPRPAEGAAIRALVLARGGDDRPDRLRPICSRDGEGVPRLCSGSPASIRNAAEIAASTSRGLKWRRGARHPLGTRAGGRRAQRASSRPEHERRTGVGFARAPERRSLAEDLARRRQSPARAAAVARSGQARLPRRATRRPSASPRGAGTTPVEDSRSLSRPPLEIGTSPSGSSSARPCARSTPDAQSGRRRGAAAPRSEHSAPRSPSSARRGRLDRRADSPVGGEIGDISGEVGSAPAESSLSRSCGGASWGVALAPSRAMVRPPRQEVSLHSATLQEIRTAADGSPPVAGADRAGGAFRARHPGPVSASGASDEAGPRPGGTRRGCGRACVSANLVLERRPVGGVCNDASAWRGEHGMPCRSGQAACSVEARMRHRQPRHGPPTRHRSTSPYAQPLSDLEKARHGRVVATPPT